MTAKTTSESTSKQKEGATMPLTHDVPAPLSFEKSKLDWLLAINEQYFEAELKTVVSYFSFNCLELFLIHLI